MVSFLNLQPNAPLLGVAATSQNGPWPNGKHGVCGDALDGPQKYMQPRAVTETYTVGQIIDIQVTITAYHKGRVEFAVCPNSIPDEQCFAQYPLTRYASHWGLATIGHRGPHLTCALPCACRRADSLHPGNKYYYLESSPANITTHLGSPTYNLKYRLPAGLTCNNCVLRW